MLVMMFCFQVGGFADGCRWKFWAGLLLPYFGLHHYDDRYQ
jgi:hypothetical protein